MVDISTVLSTLRMQVDDEIQPVFLEMEDLWERKLWFQLTETMLVLFKDPRSEPVRFRLFENFIASFEQNLNKLAFVSLAIAATSQRSPQESLAFLKGIASELEQDHRDVWCFAQLHIAQLQVQLEQLLEAKKLIDQAAKVLDESTGPNPVINTAYYGTCCEYYKKKADYTAYYRHSLLFLACVKESELSEQAKQARAYDMAIAALLGDETYNFGELVLHPILKSLSGEYQWLQDLVLLVNAGDMKAFQTHRQHLSKVPLLESNAAFLDQKICLMALCECVFRRGATERVLSFDTIAKETYLHAESAVEILVLKAFSMDLLRGSIDQVERTVSVSWLQPRVLDKAQIASVRDKLLSWDSEVQNLEKWMHVEGSDIWVN